MRSPLRLSLASRVNQTLGTFVSAQNTAQNGHARTPAPWRGCRGPKQVQLVDQRMCLEMPAREARHGDRSSREHENSKNFPAGLGLVHANRRAPLS